jgi:pimeloyl-ACP methyl ester carboxylesterase
MSHSPPPRNGSIPTVLLVHGAFADGSMWAGVISELQAAGIGVVAVASPLRSLASDAAYVASAVSEIDGPVLLAGHDYGGSVISVSGSAAANIAGLVYVATADRVIPPEGQQFMARRAGAHTIEIDASHAIALT